LSAAAPAAGSVDAVEALLARGGYVPERALATALYLALALQRPLFLEGEPGTGKTEVARVLARELDTELIRLQCYEGLELRDAAYEWNHARQLLEIRLAESGGLDAAAREALARDLYSDRFLVARPLLRALQAAERAPVLLIDELDRADEAFEAFLLELLADFQMTLPERGTVRAVHPPHVIITSNRTREIHDAVKRRCLYHWLGYPDAEREFAILRERVAACGDALARQIVAFVQALRGLDLYKNPGISESIEWARALLALDAVALDPHCVGDTLGVLLKYQDDIARVQGSEAARLLRELGLAAA
jgi:MoxR-like ATPase